MNSLDVFLLFLLPFEIFCQNMFFVTEGSDCNIRNGVKGICRRASGCVRTRTSRFDTDQKTDINLRCGFTGMQPLTCCLPTTKLANKACKKFKKEAYPKSSFTIAGGKNAEPGEFPHMVALWYPPSNDTEEITSSWGCAGSLINEFYVLTAAHCLVDQAPTKMRVGDMNLQSNRDDKNAQTVDVAEIIVHPKYYNAAQSRYNDIGLVKSKKKISFGYFVYPACLHTTGDVSSFAYSIVGWGSKELNEKSTLHIDQPLKVTSVEAINNQNCFAAYNKSATRDIFKRGINDNLICAKSPSGGKSGTCQGDSGGPLQYINDGEVYHIVGVTSHGMTCGDEQPGIYTKVRKFAPWIETMVWGREEKRPKKGQ